MMLAASLAALVAPPAKKISDERPDFSLERMIPKRFGDWHEKSASRIRVVNPQGTELLNRLYSQVLSRIYVNTNGYRIMLSIAYGTDQRGSLQAHKPEACYPAQGFVLHRNQAGLLSTAFGKIAVRRLFGTLRQRQEPITYWFTIGDRAVQGKLRQRLVQLWYGLHGRIPDGILFRVSSIDANLNRAFGLQDQFVNQLLESISPRERRQLSGLGDR